MSGFLTEKVVVGVKMQMKIRIIILGMILLLGGLGLAIYGTMLPYQYSRQAIITDETQTYTAYVLQMGNSTSFSQNVASWSWMEINVFAEGDNVEINVTGSVSGQLYDLDSDSFLQIISFSSTETITVKILDPSVSYGSSTSICGTFTFEHYGIQYETRYQMEPLYLLFGGVILCGGIVMAIYGVISNRKNRPITFSS